MNAPARIPTESAHRATIATFLPGEDDTAMDIRCDIAALRDQASAGLRRATDEAAPVLEHIATLATFAVYAPMDAAQLVLLLAALRNTMESARYLDRAYRATRDG